MPGLDLTYLNTRITVYQLTVKVLAHWKRKERHHSRSSVHTKTIHPLHHIYHLGLISPSNTKTTVQLDLQLMLRRLRLRHWTKDGWSRTQLLAWRNQPLAIWTTAQQYTLTTHRLRSRVVLNTRDLPMAIWNSNMQTLLHPKFTGKLK